MGAPLIPVDPTKIPTEEETRQAAENVTAIVRWFRALVRLFRKPKPHAVLALVAMLTAACTSAQIATTGAVVGGVGGIIKIIGSVKVPTPPPDLEGATPTPVPTATPAPTVATPPVPHGNPCDPTQKADCDCLEYRAPNWMYKACPEETPEPTAAPTPTPTPTPYEPQEGCLDLASVPALAVPVITTGACARGFKRVDFLDGQHGCVAYWHCADGDDGKNCPTRAQTDVNFRNWQPGADGFIANDEHPRIDAYCRNLFDDNRIMQPGPEPDGYVPKAWERVGICRPFICAPKPTPVPTRGTPPPRPSSTQPDDFRASFVASCQRLGYTEDTGDGVLKGQCDTTIRYGGTLKSTGQFYRNSCDRDHWMCAVEDCSDRIAEIGVQRFNEELIEHRKTFELCGGNEWVTPAGTTLVVTGAIKVERHRSNPYQFWVWGHRDDAISLHACMTPGAMRDDGVPIPTDGAACGGEHPVTFEEPR